MNQFQFTERVAELLDNAVYLRPRSKYLPELSTEDKNKLTQRIEFIGATCAELIAHLNPTQEEKNDER